MQHPSVNTIKENTPATRIEEQHCYPLKTSATSPLFQPVAACDVPSPPNTSSTDFIPNSSANQIQLLFSTSTRQPSSPLPNPSPQPMSVSISSSSPPVLGVETIQPQDLRHPHTTSTDQLDPDKIENVVHEASQLKDLFVKVLIHTKVEFSEKPAEFLAKLRITLITLPISDKFKHLRFLREEEDHIMSARSVIEVFKILDNYWDYTDYALLQYLVQEFGESALKKDMSEYVAALEHFEKKTTIQENNAAASDSRYPRRFVYGGYEFSTVELKLRSNPTVCTLYEARELAEFVAKQSCLEPYVVRQEKALSGSVVVGLVVPHYALELIIPGMDRQFMETHRIKSVTINGKPLEKYSEEYVKVCMCRRSEYCRKVYALLSSSTYTAKN